MGPEEEAGFSREQEARQGAQWPLPLGREAGPGFPTCDRETSLAI